MRVEKLVSMHKPALRALVKSVVETQGLLPQFYWPEDMLDAEMMSAEMVGVFDGEILVGAVLYRELPDAWEISLVVTSPAYMKQGYMVFLLRHLSDAKGQGRELWLEVHEENVAAQKLYEKLGFKEVRRRPRYYKDGATAVIYTLA